MHGQSRSGAELVEASLFWIRDQGCGFQGFQEDYCSKTACVAVSFSAGGRFIGEFVQRAPSILNPKPETRPRRRKALHPCPDRQKHPHTPNPQSL